MENRNNLDQRGNGIFQWKACADDYGFRMISYMKSFQHDFTWFQREFTLHFAAVLLRGIMNFEEIFLLMSTFHFYLKPLLRKYRDVMTPNGSSACTHIKIFTDMEKGPLLWNMNQNRDIFSNLPLFSIIRGATYLKFIARAYKMLKMKKELTYCRSQSVKQAVRRCYTPDLDSGIPDEIVHGRKMHYVHVVATVT